MARKDYMETGGLEALWQQIKACFLALNGGTLTNKLTISAGGIEVSGGSSSFHSSIYFDQGFGVASYDDNNGSVSLLSYSSGNIAAIAYGNASKGVTRIFGKSLVLYTNGWNARVTIGEDGNTTFSGNVMIYGEIEGPTIASLASGIGQVSVMAQDHSVILATQDARVSELESYFNGDIPKKAVSALGLSGVTINYSIGGVAQTGLTIPDADTSAAGVVSTGTQTFAGDKTFGGITTFKKSTASTTPLTVATSYSTGDNAARAAIKFAKNDGSALGYIGCRIENDTKEPYYNDSTYHTIWHAGNSNRVTVDWACNDLTANGDISAVGNISTVGSVSAAEDISAEGDVTAGANISAVGTLTVGGNATLSGTLGVTGLTTMAYSSFPLVLQNANSTVSQQDHVGITFKSYAGTIWGYIGVRNRNDDIYPFFQKGSSIYRMWHSANSNLLTVSWKCLDLTANGDISAVGDISSVGNVTAEGNIVASGGVAAGGIADLSIII